MKILLIGPLPKPITGVSLANQIVANYLPKYTNTQVDIINTSYKVLKEDIGRFSIKKILHYLIQYKELHKIKRANKVYITIGQTFFGVVKYYPFFLIANIYKKEIIVHVHGNHLWKEYLDLNGIKKKIFYSILSMAEKGIVLSKSLEKNMLPFIDKKNIYILENFVEDFLFEKIKPKKFDCLKIIFLSNLMEEKGIIDLLEALIILKKQGVPFQAKIAGGMDVSMQDKLNDYFEQLKKNVEYFGLVYGKEKKELLDWGNVFVFPTYYSMEGQPISLFEAMATGNIILTTQHAGIPDVFKENINGFYVDKQSPLSIANKLIELDKNLRSYKYISDNNMNEAKRKYRVENFILKLNDILEK
ncbi:glycosyltransferase family 4 protein [Hydrogenimonas urashimensis]|uniref:glycosyltransferase family 4 protein n=1 Tax=Hydrogenimonas urashimensis TaxID=2740515 RepID=UPI0019157DF6|nr:glycosyltransferase family 4 protein [Hydrogenimonas urashimensis]